jgi:hypothetical protein
MEKRLERLKEIFEILKTGRYIKNVADLSRKITYSPSALLNIFNGTRSISPGFLQALKDHFPAINLDYILAGEGKPIDGVISWYNPNRKVKYINEDQLGSFGMKYNDENFIEDLPESYFDMGIELQESDRMFFSPYRHPDEVFLKGDRLYTVETRIPKVGDSYFVSTKKHEIKIGIYSSDESGYYLQDINPMENNKRIGVNDIVKYWEIYGRVTMKVRPSEAYLSMSPREAINMRKSKG